MNSRYEVKHTETMTGRGHMPDFRTLVKALDGCAGEHGDMLVTYDEAVSIVKRPGLTLFLHVRQQAPSKANPEYAYTAQATVRVTRRAAKLFLEHAYRYHKDRAMVEMALHGKCLFIG